MRVLVQYWYIRVRLCSNNRKTVGPAGSAHKKVVKTNWKVIYRYLSLFNMTI